DLRLQNQPSAHDRFAFMDQLEPQNVLLREPVIAAEQALNIQTLFEIVPGQDELCGFSGGQDAAMVGAFDTAELGEVSALWKMLGDNFTEEIGPDMRRESEQENNMFFEGQLVMTEDLHKERSISPAAWACRFPLFDLPNKDSQPPTDGG